MQVNSALDRRMLDGGVSEAIIRLRHSGARASAEGRGSRARNPVIPGRWLLHSGLPRRFGRAARPWIAPNGSLEVRAPLPGRITCDVDRPTSIPQGDAKRRKPIQAWALVCE